MRAGALALAVLMAGAWHAPALAEGSVEDRLQQMEQRIRYLEQRVADQDKTIVQKDEQISMLTGGEDEPWFGKVGLGGLIEVELNAVDGGDDDGTNELTTATVEVGIAAQVNDWVGAEMLLEMDGDAVAVADAFVTLEPPGTPVSISLGKQGMPFGTYESGLRDDPLTKDLGDTGEDGVVAGFALGSVSASFFAFEGGVDRGGDGQVEDFGVAAGWSMETDAVSMGVNVSWINDIGETDDLEGSAAGGDAVPGAAAGVVMQFGGMTAIAEYVAAIDDFGPGSLGGNASAVRPSAWTVEAGYGFDMYGREAGFAIGYSQSMEAADAGLDETRVAAAFSLAIDDGLGLTVGWARSEPYAGEEVVNVGATIAAEF